MHLQSCCFAHKINCFFFTLSLYSWWLLKLPIVGDGRIYLGRWYLHLPKYLFRLQSYNDL